MKPERSSESRITPLNFIEEFKEESSFRRHYSYYRSTSLTYRILFLGLGTVFSFMGLYVILKTLNWTGSLIFKHPEMVRITLCSLCFILATWAFALGIGIRSEREACKNLVRKGKEKLYRLFQRKTIELGVEGLYFFGEKKVKRSILTNLYRCTTHQVDEHLEDALYNLRHLDQRTGFDLSKRELFINEVLHQLQENIEEEIEEFNSQ